MNRTHTSEIRSLNAVSNGEGVVESRRGVEPQVVGFVDQPLVPLAGINLSRKYLDVPLGLEPKLTANLAEM